MLHLTRRHVLRLAGAAAATATASRLHAEERFGIIGAAQYPSGAFRVGALGAELDQREGAGAPLRLHALCPRPDGAEAVAVARRPGDLALVLDGRGAAVVGTFHASEGRRFSGHGVYRDGGATFLSAEIDAETGEGFVVIHDVRGGYAPRGEFRSGGVGPHELVGAGGLVVVANGSKEPKSDPGIAALDRTAARSNVALIDPVTGAAESVAGLGDDLATLSLRHLAVAPDGAVLVAAQDTEQGARDRPLVARIERGRLRFLDEALSVTPRFNGYVGSLVVDRSGRYAAASSPKGGVVAAFDLSADEALGVVAIPDVCGLAADRESGRFIATTGLGDVLRLAVHEGGIAVVERRAGRLRWDNHLAPLPA